MNKDEKTIPKKITIPWGDTYAAVIGIKKGEIPEGAKIVFSVQKNAQSPLLICKHLLNNSILQLSHEETTSLSVGRYIYTFRLYTDDYGYVETPITQGPLEIEESGNRGIRPD